MSEKAGKFKHKYLKELIDRKGLKVKFVADSVGIKPESLRRIYAGDAPPSKPVVKLLSQVFGITEDEFYEHAS